MLRGAARKGADARVTATHAERATLVVGSLACASVGDQQSDLDGGFAECGFKVPNPFYFIP
jgi:hypothetical protein